MVPKRIQNVGRLLNTAEEAPEAARPALALLAAQLRDIRTRIAEVTKRIEARQAEDALARRLATIPSIGALTASALAATKPQVDAFRSARNYAAWLGVRSVTRTDRVPARTAEAALDRRQGTAGPDLEGREPVSRRLLFLGAMAPISARRGRKPGED